MKRLFGFLLIILLLAVAIEPATGQTDARFRDAFVFRKLEGRGGIPLYWDGFIYGQYAGTTRDCIFYNYTGSGQYLLRFQANGVDTFTINKSGDVVTTGTISGTGAADWSGAIDWSGGNVTYVPLAGDIQTYVTAAAAGDTLVLASGAYTITSTITINKELNIVGQGRAGFVTAPVTPSHGTLVTSSTAAVLGFSITSDNVRVADLSLNLTGAGSIGISVANNLEGVVFNDLDIIVNSSGANVGIIVKGSDAVVRDVTYYISSSDSTASGLYFWNDSTTTRDAVVDCWNVTGTAVGGATYAYALACFNSNDANTLTLNLSNSVAKVLPGTALDVAVASTSVATSNSTVNAYMCTLDGDDWDAYQTGTNVLSLGGSVLVNDLISGTVTYRATMTSDAIQANSIAVLGNITSNTYNFAADAEESDTYAITLSPAPAAYTTGMMIVFTANTANTGPCTINVNALGAKSIKALHDQDPPDNYIEAGSAVLLCYDGTNMQLLSPDANP